MHPSFCSRLPCDSKRQKQEILNWLWFMTTIQVFKRPDSTHVSDAKVVKDISPKETVWELKVGCTKQTEEN